MKTALIFVYIFLYITATGQEFDPLSYFNPTEIESANTATNVEYLTKEEKDIFLYNNLVRMYPQKFHQLYVDFCKNSGRERYLETDHYYTTLSTTLLHAQPVSAVLPDKEMFETAECWAIESGEHGVVGHDRITCDGGYFGENCSYGLSAGFSIIMQLLIDHGIESLGHRKNMLSSRWKGLGTAIRPHSGYGMCAVQNFTNTNYVLRAQAEKRKLEREAAELERLRLLDLRKQELFVAMDKWSDKERMQADVCRDLEFLNDFEKDFYFYYNLVRMYPSKFRKLIWEQGPYFDQHLEEQKTSIHRTPNYVRFEKMLRLTKPKPAFVPKKEYMDAGRCAIEKWANSGNVTSCLPGPGSWRTQSFYSEDTHRDIMNIFLDDKDFRDLFSRQSHLIVEDGVKAFIK